MSAIDDSAAKRRAVFDELVLRVLAKRIDALTYVIKNVLRLDYRVTVKTPAVLRAARRLQKRGLVAEAPQRNTVVMKGWRITDAGRAFLDRAAATTAAPLTPATGRIVTEGP